MKPNTSILKNPVTAMPWRSRLQLLVALTLLGWGALAQAQNSTWSGLGADNNWGTAGNWDTAVVNGNSLIFGPIGNAKLGATNDFTALALTINSISLSTNGYILAGNALTINNGISDSAGSNTISIPLTLGASQTFQNNAGGGTNLQTTFSSAISLGANNLTIGGAGTVYLNGGAGSTNGGTLTVNNSAGFARLSVTGNAFGTNTLDVVTVSAGTLKVNNNSGIPSGPSVGNVLVNGTLDLDGFSPTINGLEGSGIVDSVTNAGSSTLTVGAGNSNAVFSGVIKDTAGTVALTKTGWGKQVLGGANTYSGSTIINQGTLTVAAGGSLGQSSSALTIDSGAVLDVSALTPYGGFIPQSALVVSAGTASKPYTNFLGSYDTNNPNYIVTLTGATNTVYVTNLDLTITTNYVPATATNSIIGVITNDIEGDFSVEADGAISPVSTVAPGIATWTINGSLTLDSSIYSGAGHPNRVAYLLNNATTPGGGTNDLINVKGKCSIGDELDVVVSPFTGTLASGQYTLIQSTNLVLTSPNDGNPANLVLIAPRGITGTFDTSDNLNLKLTASGTATPASLIWAAATNTAGANNWDTKVTQDWKNNGSSDYFYSQDNVIFDDTGFGTVNIPIPVTPGAVTFNNNTKNYAFTANTAGFISGAAGITLSGAGTVTLNNPNNFTGDVTINNGTLIMGSYGGFNNVMLYNGVTPGRLIFGAGNGVFADNWNIGDTSVNTLFSGLTLNSGANAQFATLNNRGANETPRLFIGDNINRNVGSSLYIPFGTRAGSVEGVYFTNTIPWVNGLIGGGWMHVGNDWFLAVTNFSTVAPANYNYTAYANGSTLASWASTNNVALTNTTFALTGSSNIYTLKLLGPVTLNQTAGTTLTILSGGLLVSSASGGASAITGGTLKGAAGADLIVLQNYTASPLTIGSVIADNGSATALTLGGLGGTVILTNNNTYSGATYINGGALQVGAGGTLGSIAASSSIVDNGTLFFNRSDSTSVGAVSGLGSLTQLGTGALTLTGDNTLKGLVTVSAGTLQVGNGGTTGSISNAVGVVDSTTVVFNNSGASSYGGVISGIGQLVQQGAGSLTLRTNDTYLGNTVISNGVLALSASGSISNTAGILINSGATFDVSALSGGFTMRAVAPNEIIAGNGTISGSLTSTNGGKIAPGTNGVVGTLAVTGDLTMKGGSYYFDVGTSTKDRITVGGTLNQIQANVYINPTTTLTNGVYPLITAAGGVSGSTASLIAIGFAQPGQLAKLTNSTANELDLLVYSGVAPTVTWVGDGSQNLWDESGNSHWTPGSFLNNDQVLFDDTGSASPAVNMDVVVYPNSVTVNSTSKNYILAGSNGGKISGGASLIKPGGSTSTLTLETVNDYSGVTAINGGVVQLGDGANAANDGMVGSGGAVTNNATLIATNVNAETLLGNLVGTGTLIQGGAGTLILAGNNTGFSGPIVIAANSLQVGNGFSGTLGTATVTNNGSLLFNINTPNSLAVGVPITGTGGINNVGTGVTTVSGANSYAGPTVATAGTIRMGAAGAVPATSTIVLNDSGSGPGTAGALDLNGFDLSVANLLSTNTGIGTATFAPARILNNGSTTNTLFIGGGGSYTFNGQLLDNNNSGSGRLAMYVTGNTFLNLYPGYQSSSVKSPNTFSGGMTISNATVHFGNGGQGTDLNNGQNAAGLGMITLCGGLGADINGNTGLPTNGVILPAQYGGSYNSARAEYNTYPTIYVPSGQSGSIFMDGYGGLIFPLIGSGTLTIQPSYVRAQIGGDWSQFSGTIIIQAYNYSTYGASGGGFAFTGTGTAGCPLATMIVQTNNVATVYASAGVNGPVFQIGTLAGGDDTSELGGSAHGNGTKNGNRATIWVIGGANVNATNGSRFVDTDCGIRKIGTGTQVLTNAVMSYGGQTVVSNGTLVLAPIGGGPAFINSTNNYLVSSNYTLVAPGVLDISAVGNGTLNLGHNAAQTLYGNGTLTGSLLVTNSLIAPARRANVGATYFSGSGLTVSGGVTLIGGSTVLMTVNRTNTPANDSLTAPSIVYGGTIIVTNAGDTAFAGASSNVFKLFNGAISGTFTNIILATNNLPANEFWVNNLNLDGSVALVNTASAINTNPPAMMISFNGTQLSLGWPTNAGWILQSQTNTSSVGLTTPANTWFDVAGSASITNTVITINPANPTVFYRLRLP